MQTVETIITVKAFVLRNNALLFIQEEKKGRWDVPGGRLEGTESLEDALRREVQEEIGVAIASTDFDHPWVWNWQYHATSKPLTQNIIGIGYRCTLASDVFRLAPPEHVAHAWFRREEIEQLNIVEGHKNAYVRWMQLIAGS